MRLRVARRALLEQFPRGSSNGGRDGCPAHRPRNPCFNMPKSKKPSTSSSVPGAAAVDKQMADIAAQIAALTARQDAAIKEMERAAAEVAMKSSEHARLAQELARAEIEKNRSCFHVQNTNRKPAAANRRP
jgi:hypothetical protein